MNYKIAILISLVLISKSFAQEKKVLISHTSIVSEKKKKSYQEVLGIKVESIRLSAYGKIVDFRFRVLDEKKAIPIFSPKIKPCLVDLKTGNKCYIPDSPKIGSLRSFGTPVKNRVYFMLFNNSSSLKKGDKVNLIIGDVTIENLVLE